jgi:hypothetical protein
LYVIEKKSLIAKFIVGNWVQTTSEVGSSKFFRTLPAMHTGVVHNKFIACQADRFLIDGKKEKKVCPVFLHKSNLLLKKRQPVCMAASVHN